MVDISICLACVAMILTLFIVDSIHRARTARVIAVTAPKYAVRPSVR